MTIGTVNGKTYAFIAIERIGRVMVYDITDPANAIYVNYINSREFDGCTKDAPIKGDVSPEGLCFVENVPNGNPILLTACEVSGTLAAYELKAEGNSSDNPSEGTDGDNSENTSGNTPGETTGSTSDSTSGSSDKNPAQKPEKNTDDKTEDAKPEETTQPEETTKTDADADKTVSKGTVVNDEKTDGKYQVVSAEKGKQTVQYQSTTDKKKKTVTIPNTVKVSGVTYKVTEIAKNACKGISKDTVIKVPKSKVKVYTKLFQKKGLSKKVKIQGVKC